MLARSCWVRRVFPPLVLILLPFSLSAEEQDVTRCGDYRLTTENLTEGFTAEDKFPLGVVKMFDSENRLAKIVAYRRLNIKGCADLTADGVPELMLEGYTGGTHCCWVDAIYSMGEEIKNRLVFESRTGGIDMADDLQDLNQDSVLEIFATDSSLFYFDDLTGPDFPALPLVLCYRDERYEDCTRQFPALLAEEIQRAETELRGHTVEVKRQALRFYALHVLAGEEAQGWQRLQESVPANVLSWLEENKEAIPKRITRSRKFSIRYAE